MSCVIVFDYTHSNSTFALARRRSCSPLVSLLHLFVGIRFQVPFPHGTSSLSVTHEYLGLEGGPPMFRQDFTCPALLEDLRNFYPYGAITRYGCPFQNIPVLNRRPLA